MGTGDFAEPPKQTVAYRRGYLCGLIRSRRQHRPLLRTRTGAIRAADQHAYLFRLALAEPASQAARARTADYLARTGIGCADFTLTEERGRMEAGSAQPSTYRRVTAIRTAGADQARTLEWLLSWPDHPGPEWRKGFLAGCFDARGGYRDRVLRICPTDPESPTG